MIRDIAIYSAQIVALTLFLGMLVTWGAILHSFVVF